MQLVQAASRYRALLVAATAIALAFAAVWMLVPGSNVHGQTDLGGCELTPWLRDALLDDDNYDLARFECDELDLDGLAIWDFSGRNLRSFEISDADYELLLELSGLRADSRPEELSGFGSRGEVELIDLTGNPGLDISRVSFRNIPLGTGIALSIRGTTGVQGFQDDEFTVTENRMGYVAIAFPGILETGQESLVVSVSEDVSGGRSNLVNFAPRDVTLHGDSRSVIYYWPIYVESDGEVDPDWDFELEINPAANAYSEPDGTGTRDRVDLEDLFDEQTARITVLDADAPDTEVCDRTDLVEEAIEAASGVSNSGCDITLGELGGIAELELAHDDGETFQLSRGDLEGLSGLRYLKLTGAVSMPRGIFDGVGDRESGVVIDFAQNSPSDPSDQRGGNYDLGDIPSHVLSDLEPHQKLLLKGQTDARRNPLVTGLEAGEYVAGLGQSFAVTLPVFFDAGATDPLTHFVLTQLPYDFSENTDPVIDIDGITRLTESDVGEHDVVRMMITVPEEADAEKGDWVLFVFSDDDEDFASLVDWAIVNPS